MDMRDCYRGCLLGGAAGDALGYPVEFLSLRAIRERYGASGITDYVLQDGVAQISDDTQMTLFTANGLLYFETRRRNGASGGGSLIGTMSACYGDWLYTQQERYQPEKQNRTAWLVNVPELFHRRSPGGTCLEAIARGGGGTMEQPINQSKGCGGVMRVAPAGLWLKKPGGAGFLAAQLAAITHGHELGYISAGVLGYCISALAHGEADSVLEAVQGGLDWASRQFRDARHLPELAALVQRAVRLAGEACEDTEAIRQLGEGWVAEETLAVAVYCALKYEDDFDRALIAAVNHGGDSDSTGAVTGNLLGTRVGFHGIPHKYVEHLELRSVILELADDLCRNEFPVYARPLVRTGCGTVMPEADSPEAARWYAKYDTADYVPAGTD